MFSKYLLNKQTLMKSQIMDSLMNKQITGKMHFLILQMKELKACNYACTKLQNF